VLTAVDINHHANIMSAMLRTQRRQATVDKIAAWIVGGRFGPGDTLPIEPAIGEELAPVFSALLRVSFRLSVRSLAGARASLPAHRRLLNAIIAREPGMAEAATSALIESARADIEGRIGSGPLTAAEVHA
jgi:DNA-binding FadR family transcriptional regulator